VLTAALCLYELEGLHILSVISITLFKKQSILPIPPTYTAISFFIYISYMIIVFAISTYLVAAAKPILIDESRQLSRVLVSLESRDRCRLVVSFHVDACGSCG